MNIELSPAEMKLLDMMLSKELGETRVEIRHSDNKEYRDCLKHRETHISGLLERIEAGLKALPEKG
jgi:hypothetical protein